MGWRSPQQPRGRCGPYGKRGDPDGWLSRVVDYVNAPVRRGLGSRRHATCEQMMIIIRNADRPHVPRSIRHKQVNTQVWASRSYRLMLNRSSRRRNTRRAGRCVHLTRSTTRLWRAAGQCRRVPTGNGPDHPTRSSAG